VDYRRACGLIRENEEVAAASPFISSQVMLKSQTNVSGAELRGVDPATV